MLLLESLKNVPLSGTRVLSYVCKLFARMPWGEFATIVLLRFTIIN